MDLLSIIETFSPYIIPSLIAIIAVLLGYHYQRTLSDREKRRDAYLLGLSTVIRLQYLLAAGEEMNYAHHYLRKQLAEGIQSIVSTNQRIGGGMNNQGADLSHLREMVQEYHLRVLSAASIVGTKVEWSLGAHFKWDDSLNEELERVGLTMLVAFGQKRREIRAEFITVMHAILSSGKFTWFRYDKDQAEAITNLLGCAVFLDKEVERTMDMSAPAPIDWKVVNSLVSDALNATTSELGTVRDIILDLEGISNKLNWPEDVRAKYQDVDAIVEFAKARAAHTKFHFTAQIPKEKNS
jgi:hypothetical protein